MNKQNLALGFVVALLAVGAGALGGVTFSKPVVVEKIVEQVVQEKLGASPGPVRFDSCETRNGVEQCFRSSSLRTATTTPCSLRAPTHATSTLLRGAVRFNVASTTDSVISLAKASTFNATTTGLASTTITISANAQGVFQLNNVNDKVIADDRFTFAPGQYFNVGLMQTGAGSAQVAGLAPTGQCSATFEVI